MPRSLRLGFRFYVVAMILTPLAGAFDPVPVGAVAPALGMLLAVVIPVFALKAVLTYCSWRRRNWARIALLVFTGLGLGAYAPELVRTLGATPLLGIVDLLLVILEAVAIVLLFTPTANRWYKPPAPVPTAAPSP